MTNAMSDVTWAIILAAGSGSRMGALPTAKQFLNYRGRPLYWHSAMTMARSACVDGIILVFPAQRCPTEAEQVRNLAWRDNLGLPWQVVPGGARRQDSCRNGLSRLPPGCACVLIHDAARPFASPALVRRVAKAVSAETPCVIPGIAVTDTIKLLSKDQNGKIGEIVERTLPREQLMSVQTPQGFWTADLKAAHECETDVTDDAAMLEKIGKQVLVVPGEETNCKITTPADLALLRQTEQIPQPVSGFGYDVHRYGAGRPLRLGGVPIGGHWQVIAHSDGDVLLHALMDALLGMAALGDIGRLFPDSDPTYEGISSAILLDLVLNLLRERQIRIAHVDLTVVTQKPRLAPYGEAIRSNVAKLLSLQGDCVNFKATTEEGLGFTGQLSGIKAYALVSGLKPPSSAQGI